MSILKKAVDLHRNTNAAAQAVTSPIRRRLPPREVLKTIVVISLIRIAVDRLLRKALDLAGGALWSREPAPVLRLVRE